MGELHAETALAAHDVRMFVFQHAASTGRVPQAPQISQALGCAEGEVKQVLRQLATEKVIILAPNDGDIWAANPFCAVPSGFRVEAAGNRYWGICIWDAMGIVAALGGDGKISAPCGDCGEIMHIEIHDRKILKSEGVVHFAIPAHNWWENIGFT